MKWEMGLPERRVRNGKLEVINCVLLTDLTVYIYK